MSDGARSSSAGGIPPRREARHHRDGDAAPTRAILEATEKLLASTGLSDLTVATIIEAAGVSRGTFYFYFTSKHSVLAALLRGILTDISAATRTYTERGETAPTTSLHRMMEAIVDIYAQHTALLRAASENWHADTELADMYETMTARIIDGLTEQIDRERTSGLAPKTVEPRALAAALTWMNERTLYAAASGIEPALRLDEALADTLASVWAGAIYGRPQGAE